jgi:hypothetical protein
MGWECRLDVRVASSVWDEMCAAFQFDESHKAHTGRIFILSVRPLNRTGGRVKLCERDAGFEKCDRKISIARRRSSQENPNDPSAYMSHSPLFLGFANELASLLMNFP